jgi:hypothetical protein
MSILLMSHQQHQDPVPVLADLLRAPRAYILDLVPTARAQLTVTPPIDPLNNYLNP